MMPLTASAAAAIRMHERYGAEQNWTADSWNETLETLLQHRSVRHYLPKPLLPRALETAIAAAQSASSSSNLQAWSVVAIMDPERKARLAEMAGSQKHIVDAPLFLVWLADLSRISHAAAQQNVDLVGLPYIETLVIGIVDAALAAQNAVIAFESLGLGTVYIGGIRNNVEQVAAELQLPSHVMPVFGMCVGYPDPRATQKVKPRLPQDAVLHHETYTAEQDAAIALYDDRAQNFFAAQGQDHMVWSTQIVNRLKSIRALSGRDRLRDALHKFGFGLK